MNKHPIQPLYLDDKKVLRFKENKIVRFLLDNGGIDLNQLACLDFQPEDREQFAQLIGYSLSGFGELGYVSSKTYEAAEEAFHDPELSEKDARIENLENELDAIRQSIKPGVAKLFGLHPDDLDAGMRP